MGSVWDLVEFVYKLEEYNKVFEFVTVVLLLFICMNWYVIIKKNQIISLVPFTKTIFWLMNLSNLLL